MILHPLWIMVLCGRRVDIRGRADAEHRRAPVTTYANAQVGALSHLSAPAHEAPQWFPNTLLPQRDQAADLRFLIRAGLVDHGVWPFGGQMSRSCRPARSCAFCPK